MEEIINECKIIVDEICSKYGYEIQDVEGNDSLRTVLLKAIPSMLQDQNYENRQLFYQMLRKTPIVITENLTNEAYEGLIEKYIGKNVNKHIVDEDIDLGEYGKGLGAGAYVSEPIFDENMNLKEKKSFIYIQKVDGSAKDFFSTDINVAHLIHELGHAWNAEKDQYTMQNDGTLKERIGTAEFIYSFSDLGNNKFSKKCISSTGLMIEESMNTVAEEIAMANYMQIPIEQMRDEYRFSLVPSNYQGYMSSFMEYTLNILEKSDFEKYRLYGNEESKNKINSLMEKTEYWKNRETDILPSSKSPRNYNNKKSIISKISDEDIQEFFEKYKSVYFPNISQMTPLEKVENVLQQQYNFNSIKYTIDIEHYRELVDLLGYEGYSLINQSADLLELQHQKESEKSNETSNISINSVVKNALQQGTSLEQVNKAKGIEQQENKFEKEIDKG